MTLAPIDTLNKKIEKALQIRGLSFDGIDINGGLISDALIQHEIIPPDEANIILEEASGVRFLDPTIANISDEFLSHATLLVPKNTAITEKVFPIKHEGQFAHLCMAVPNDLDCIRRMEYVTGSLIKPYCCYTKGIFSAIQKYYPDGNSDGKIEPPQDDEGIISWAVQDVTKMLLSSESRMRMLNSVAIIKLLQHILNKLAATNTSDIHFEPMENAFRVRFRKDGVLQTAWQLPSVVKQAFVDRIKLISKMNLEEAYLPQDGSVGYHLIKNREIDLRVSSLPSLHGDKIVMRLLEKDRKQFTLQDLGMEQEIAENIDSIIQRPYGLVLVTGPTGSGKSTSLYAFLNSLNTEHVNIVTAEDPVEYKLSGITQVTCSRESRLDFKDALKSFLRQDPDIIMVGEIRDIETADIAIKAAMTGHLVLSTLHTNDAAGAVTRLINMGIPPFLITSAHVTVLAQRLLRKLCNHCKREREATPNESLLFGIDPTKRWNLYDNIGCDHCFQTGYDGRIGIYELFSVSETISQLILDNQPTGILKNTARQEGMITLREAAIEKLIAGVTSIEEVQRVTIEEE